MPLDDGSYCTAAVESDQLITQRYSVSSYLEEKQLSAIPDRRACLPGGSAALQAAPLALDPVALPARKSKAAGDRGAPRHRQAQTALLADPEDVTARPRMPPDIDRKDTPAHRQLVRRSEGSNRHERLKFVKHLNKPSKSGVQLSI
jgi:hypothetical protein